MERRNPRVPVSESEVLCDTYGSFGFDRDVLEDALEPAALPVPAKET